MAWFNKKTKRIEAVPPDERVVKTENVFVKCDGCEAHLFKGELDDGLQVCKHCGHHFRIGARERLALLFDDGKSEELDNEVISIDPLEFADSKPYPERLSLAKESSGLPEAIISGRGTVGDHPVCAGAMDMLFIGGSMGSAVGEKVTRLIERAGKAHRHLFAQVVRVCKRDAVACRWLDLAAPLRSTTRLLSQFLRSGHR